MATVENGAIKVSSDELCGFLKLYIREYKFTNNNKIPAKILLPPIKDIDGIAVEIDYASLVVGGKPEEEKVLKQEVSHATTSG